ncbi:hypothetical protein [Priestia megaterium]|jgi:hypothetical protein|uniref:hypothetical protein n=1 Tax=Priestia megaterium TaxID=1404 RepID=UPI0004025E80|nr:hypothetical protein [Priestia megaterium]RFB33276.1 hypothetical protein DZB86_27745 [Bacillus sp. RC]MBW0933699.1 hypothetical protein [Priestia megaterium]MCR8866765.1 hypothetical protein [Priestia megaterium]MED3929231.1 hypothetical protein [Priestia megaterium]PFK66408.1 hypothetical protein COJ21_24580 [Priestia megaterium]
MNYSKEKMKKKNIVLGIIYAIIVLSVYAFNLPVKVALSILALVIVFELISEIKEGKKNKIYIHIFTICLLILGAIFL